MALDTSATVESVRFAVWIAPEANVAFKPSAVPVKLVFVSVKPPVFTVLEVLPV